MKEDNKQAASIRQVFSFCREWKSLIIGSIFAGISGISLPAFTFLFAQVFEDLAASSTNEDFLESIRNVSLSIVALGGVVFVTMTLQTVFSELMAADMTIRMKEQWFEALLRKDMAFFDTHDVKEEAMLVNTSGITFRKGVGRKLMAGIQYFITFLGALSYAFYASWEVSLSMIAVSPFVYVAMKFLVNVQTTQTKRANESYAHAGAIANTAVRSIRTILSLNAVEYTVQEYQEATKQACRTAIDNSWALGLANAGTYVSMIISYMVVGMFGGYLLFDNVKENGCDPSATVEGVDSCDPEGKDVFGALFGVSFAVGVLPMFSLTLEAFSGARIACYRAIQMIESNDVDEKRDVEQAEPVRRTRIDPLSEKGQVLNDLRGDIEFQDVYFAYPSRPESQILSGLSFSIKAGSTLGIVGLSGSGKSTIVHLLERFYDVKSGRIMIDGVDLRQLNVRWLREEIGLVMQNPRLFNRSIAENIALGRTDITQDMIEEAAKLANAYSFVCEFPNSYRTQVGDLGNQLSGGQKGRIALARILARKPKILVLDEATSALDTHNERIMQEALDAVAKKKTVTTLVIAHRLSTLRNVDNIVVLQDGKIIESGSHDQLMECKGRFYELVQAQIPNKEPNVVPQELSNSSESLSSTAVSWSTSLGQDNERDIILRFRNVSFSYPSRPDRTVLKGLNLAVRRGETLGLVGASGSGKSTIFALLERFYDPSEGTIELNGTDLRSVNVKSLRSQLALVDQDSTLFDTTVEANISYGIALPKEDIRQAAAVANANVFIESFGDGYETQVGDLGSKISGGQRQRITLARAIARHSKILLLDEPTSSLDSENEALLEESLARVTASEENTCLIIAHRLSTLKNAQRIAVIDKGHVLEIGTYDELMALDGLFTRFARIQQLTETIPIDKVDTTLEKDDEGAPTNVCDEVRDTNPECQDETKRAWSLGRSELNYILIGGIGALLVGLFFPAWGVTFSFMTEVMYERVEECPFTDIDSRECEEYYLEVSDDMKRKTFGVFYGYLGLVVTGLIGNALLFFGFGSASERLNEKVRNAAFESLIRQEISYFDLRPVSEFTSRLADDTALLHAFIGEPIRTLLVSLSSVLVGVILAFAYMWEFALLCLAIIPLLGFGAEMEMRTYTGEDDGSGVDQGSAAGTLIETLSNIQTIASLTLEDDKLKQYGKQLRNDESNLLKACVLLGGATGLGQFFQFAGFGLMFWWGGWLILNQGYSFRSYLIALWGLFFSMYGLTVAAEGAVDRKKARRAAKSIFSLIDRKSAIDPLGDEGIRL